MEAQITSWETKLTTLLKKYYEPGWTFHKRDYFKSLYDLHSKLMSLKSNLKKFKKSKGPVALFHKMKVDKSWNSFNSKIKKDMFIENVHQEG
jgi:hypothetical protein